MKGYSIAKILVVGIPVGLLGGIIFLSAAGMVLGGVTVVMSDDFYGPKSIELLKEHINLVVAIGAFIHIAGAVLFIRQNRGILKK